MDFSTIDIDSPMPDNIMADIAMPAIIEISAVVEEALDRLGRPCSDVKAERTISRSQYRADTLIR